MLLAMEDIEASGIKIMGYGGKKPFAVITLDKKDYFVHGIKKVLLVPTSCKGCFSQQYSGTNMSMQHGRTYLSFFCFIRFQNRFAFRVRRGEEDFHFAFHKRKFLVHT